MINTKCLATNSRPIGLLGLTKAQYKWLKLVRVCKDEMYPTIDEKLKLITSFIQRAPTDIAPEFIDGLLDEMSRLSVPPSVITFNVLIKHHSQTIDDAVRWVHKMKKLKVSPTIHTLNQVILFCRTWSEYKGVKQDMSEYQLTYDVVTYTTLMQRLCQNSIEANQIITRMKDNGIEPNETTYIVWLGYQARLSEAMSMIGGHRLTNKMVTVLINQLCETMTDVNTVTNKLIQQGGALNTTHWTAIVKKIGCHTLSELNQYKKIGFRPNIVTYSTLLQNDNLSLTDAIEVMKDMESIGIMPDLRIYTQLIRKCTNLDDVNQCLNQINALNLPVDDIVYSVILERFNDHDAVGQYYEQVTNKPDDRGYEIDFHGCYWGTVVYFLRTEILNRRDSQYLVTGKGHQSARPNTLKLRRFVKQYLEENGWHVRIDVYNTGQLICRPPQLINAPDGGNKDEA